MPQHFGAFLLSPGLGKVLTSSHQKWAQVQELVCPRCRLQMLTITFREWEVALCPRCEGTFYEEPTLDTLLRQPDLRLSYLRPALLPNLASPHPDEVDRARIVCPLCPQTMTREAYSEENPLLVDRCPDGHGIWLDDGELGTLAAKWERSYSHVEPSFWEGLRRLLGLRPRVVIDTQDSP